jgi:hypothetical protein
VLQGPRVVAIVRDVWVDREWHLGGLADALDEPWKLMGPMGPR